MSAASVVSRFNVASAVSSVKRMGVVLTEPSGLMVAVHSNANGSSLGLE